MDALRMTPAEYREYMRRGAVEGWAQAGATVDCGPGRAAAKGPSEHDEQVRLFRLLDEMKGERPEVVLAFAIPNGGQRSKAVAGKLRAEGVKAGVPDIFLPVARDGKHGLFVELKRAGGRASPEQRAWLAALEAMGYAAVVAVGADAALALIVEYLDS